ncbi:fam-g protein [Plasmodium gallinaceum]|uniref:Fam-g protein n=1 Tax=Plasmodium gallinaceum TaxID=5849 RepID=A0A1J1GPP8_PLAGA|nr:fam-g protein [Plasmodium gallinaceum]CRG94482.1 fam-g protein [Plasmodium gallinaceum]
MKSITLYLKITTFFLLIWMYQCFFNCDSYKTLIDKNIPQAKNELKNERVLTEGDISGIKRTYVKECIEKCPLYNKKNKCKDPDKYKDPSDYWYMVVIPKMWDRFNQETSEMDPKLKKKKWNVEWHKISTSKVKDLHLMSRRRDITYEEKKRRTDNVLKELDSKFEIFLCECNKEMRDNKTESKSKKEMRENKTESESKKKMRDNKAESESKKEMRDNKTESESDKEMRDYKTESESKKEMKDNKTESESDKVMKDNKTESESDKEMKDNKTESESDKEKKDNKTESESKKEMRENKTESESRKEQGSNEIKNYKLKIWKLLIILIILRRININGLTENIGLVMHKI